ncbi:TerD family protein [Nocardia brevicatena]|uniref:TerD family protein n=1 Tax=Nocardia brevicatena TaxID=37327 RepID=UPI000594B539|nr:TerD family protein [Nocardia brevicatena]
MNQLQPGQNIPLTGGVVVFRAEAAVPLVVSALVVDADLRVGSAADVVSAQRPEVPGVRLAIGSAEVTVAPAEIRAEAQAVLLVVGSSVGTSLGAVTAVLSEAERRFAEFAIAPIAGETALICFEVYRRGGGWKLRAVGQGYAGGLPELLRTHGAESAIPAVAGRTAGPRAGSEVPAASPPAPISGAAAQPTDASQSATVTPTAAGGPTPPAPPLEVGHGLERLWMIFEDAARSAAALESARSYAAKRLDQELSSAVSDPATRNTPTADAARAAAQRRYDELTATAESSHRRDSAQLQRELAEADTVLPPSLASWESPAWDRPPVPADGIRIGELYAAERGTLRIPYCVPVPLNRPLWIDTESSAAVAPVVGALLARLLAALPQHRTVVDLIDLTGAFSGFTGWLAPVLGSPPVTDYTDISPRLQALVDSAELAEMAYHSGAGAPLSEHRILVAADFPHGYQPLDAQRLGMLMVRGGLIGLSTVIVGTNESDSSDSTIAALSRSCRHVPTAAGTPLFDPWTDNAWQLDLDLLPQEPERQVGFLRVR